MEDKSKAAAAAGLAGPELTPVHRGLDRLNLFKNKSKNCDRTVKSFYSFPPFFSFNSRNFTHFLNLRQFLIGKNKEKKKKSRIKLELTCDTYIIKKSFL